MSVASLDIESSITGRELQKICENEMTRKQTIPRGFKALSAVVLGYGNKENLR